MRRRLSAILSAMNTNAEAIVVVTTGGTIDKAYFDALSGQIFTAGKVRKDRIAARFVPI